MMADSSRSIPRTVVGRSLSSPNSSSPSASCHSRQFSSSAARPAPPTEAACLAACVYRSQLSASHSVLSA